MENIVLRPISTTSNLQRKKELEKWFEKAKYNDSHTTLHKMLGDPKVKSLLDDKYSHLWGDTPLHFSVMEVPSCALAATNPILDLGQSLLPALTDPEKLEQLFFEPIVIDKPIITFRRNYVVDGHFSWIQAAAFNPDKRMIVLDYDGDFSPILFFRAIRKAVAEDNKNDGGKAFETTEGFNLFSNEFTESGIKEFIIKNITKEIVACCVEHIDDCTNDESTIDWIVENLSSIKYNNYPESF